MGKPIEDIRGPSRSDSPSIQNSLQKSSSFFKNEETTPSVFPNPPLRVFEEKDRSEIKEIDSEIHNNPFLARYAHHGGGNNDFGRIRSNSGGSKKNIWIVAGVALFVALVSLTFAFARATVLVTPAQFVIPLDTELAVTYQSQTGFSFEKMTVENTQTDTVTSSGTSMSDMPAKGTVRFYNTYSTTKQNLLINTRLEAPDGKIYMTDTPVSIPGYTKQGTEIVPGTVDVAVHAEKPGPDYNREPTDFVIYGWKSDPVKSKKIYARSTTPLVGGSSGLTYTITDEEYASAMTELDAQGRQKIRNQIYAEVPEGYFTFDDAIVISELERSYAKSSTDIAVPVTLALKATAYIFPKDAFVQAVRSKAPDTLTISDDIGLSFSSASTALFTLPQAPGTDATTLTVSVKGDVVLEAIYDAQGLLGELLGEKTKDVSTILANNEAIESLQVKMRPPWKRSFPSDPSNIEIISAQPKE